MPTRDAIVNLKFPYQDMMEGDRWCDAPSRVTRGPSPCLLWGVERSEVSKDNRRHDRRKGEGGRCCYGTQVVWRTRPL